MGFVLTIEDKFTLDTIVFPKRRGLRWSTVVDGGCEDLSFSVPCDWMPVSYTPRMFGHVTVFDDVKGIYIWCGFLQKPKWRKVRGQLESLEFTALGYYHLCERDEYENPVVFGPAVTGVTNLFKIVTPNIEDAVSASLALCPSLVGTPRIAATGIALIEDTASFAGQSPVNVWNAMKGYAGSLLTPIIWKVNPDPATGVPYLDWFTDPAAPEYFEDGACDECELEVDSNAFINKSTVAWGNNQKYTNPLVGPLDETVIPAPYQIRKYLHVGQDINAYLQADQLSANLLNRFSEMRITGGQGVLKQAIDGVVLVPTPGPYNYEPHEIVAGHHMRFDVTDINDAYYNVLSALIGKTEYVEEDCANSWSIKAIDEIGQDVRMVNVVDANKSLTWGIMFPELNIPYPPLDKAPQLGQEFPTAARGPTESKIGTATVQVALTDSLHDHGDQGGQILPGNLPPNRFDWVGNIISDDGTTPPIPANDSHIEVPMQYGFVRRVQLKAKRGQSGAIVVHIDKYNPTTLVTIADFILISLAAANFNQVIYTTPSHAIDDGDYLIVRTVGPSTGTITQCTISVHGYKRWPNFPTYPKVSYSFAGWNPDHGTIGD